MRMMIAVTLAAAALASTVSAEPPYVYCVARSDTQVLVSDIFPASAGRSLDGMTKSWSAFAAQKIRGNIALASCSLASSPGKIGAYGELDAAADSMEHQPGTDNQVRLVPIVHTGWAG